MKKSRFFIFIAGLLVAFAATAFAQFPVIDADQLRKQMTANAPALLIDSRTAEEYQQGHIPGSVNIMPEAMASSSKLPKDKNRTLIFYCRGMS